ncbi:unnamed protein product [Withania somnifera]
MILNFYLLPVVTSKFLAYCCGVEAGILCEPCGGTGWLLCDFCKGQKTYVKSEIKKIHRRCPSCRAVGCLLCSKCKVFKCVTFPNDENGEVHSF